MNSNEFIEKSIIIHNNYYDYSLIEYIGVNKKVKIICPKHGVFDQIPKSHLKGHGCNLCGIEKSTISGTKSKTLTTQEFVDRSNKLFNFKYDYSKVNYIDGRLKVNIICLEHGEFIQQAELHLKGKGCPKCGKLERIRKTSLSQDVFIDRAKHKHHNIYDYSLVKYKNMHTKVTIICPFHKEFEQTPQHHLLGSGCPICNKSKGEIAIANWLLDNKIDFTPQKRFDTCRNVLLLPFDFYLTRYNICIEFDGIQHFKAIENWGGEKHLNETKINDTIKTNWCKENNIKLIRIPYTEVKGIHNILSDEIKF